MLFFRRNRNCEKLLLTSQREYVLALNAMFDMYGSKLASFTYTTFQHGKVEHLTESPVKLHTPHRGLVFLPIDEKVLLPNTLFFRKIRVTRKPGNLYIFFTYMTRRFQRYTIQVDR